MPTQKIKTILKWVVIVALILVGFSEPTAELFPFQIIAWAILVGIVIKEKSNEDLYKRCS